MGSYEIDPSQALETAQRFIKEGRASAVKLEGGTSMVPAIRRISEVGIPVLAHVGLTPQRSNSFGGFRVQGKSCAGAIEVLRDALAVQEAGAFAVVLEAVPEEVARLITKKLEIPTIGIGAGNGCSGQVLVQADMTGNFPPGRFLPKFVKQYGNVFEESFKAIKSYRGESGRTHALAVEANCIADEVKAGTYPQSQHTYPMPQEEFAEFERVVEREMRPARPAQDIRKAIAAAAGR